MSARNIFTLMQAVGDLGPVTIAFPTPHEFQHAKRGVLFTVFLPLHPCFNGKMLVACITGNGGLKICARSPILANCLSNIRYTRTSGSHRSRSHSRIKNRRASDASSQAPKALYTATPTCLGPTGLQLASSSTSPAITPSASSNKPGVAYIHATTKRAASARSNKTVSKHSMQRTKTLAIPSKAKTRACSNNRLTLDNTTKTGRRLYAERLPQRSRRQ